MEVLQLRLKKLVAIYKYGITIILSNTLISIYLTGRAKSNAPYMIPLLSQPQQYQLLYIMTLTKIITAIMIPQLKPQHFHKIPIVEEPEED